MKVLIFVLLLAVAPLYAQQPEKPIAGSGRFAITERNKKGFIDRQGRVVIQPRYEAVQEFNEGLCAVRLNGVYGFIDEQGAMLIQPAYDYATEFSEGLALVYLDGRPIFIDRSGKPVFYSPYKHVFLFQNGRSYVMTHSGKFGIIDKGFKLLIDTLYNYIGPFSNGFAIVSRIKPQINGVEGPDSGEEYSVIDESGKQLIPFGTYWEISHPGEGYFLAKRPPKSEKDSPVEEIVDGSGKRIYICPRKGSEWIGGPVSNGIFRLSGERKRKPGEYYDRYLKLSGEVVFDSKEVRDGNDFSEGFAFYRSSEGGYSLINRRGQIIAHNKFDGIQGDGFKNGMIAVETDEGWGVIDTTARFVAKPKFKDINTAALKDGIIIFLQSSNEDAFFLSDTTAAVSDSVAVAVPVQEDEYAERYGFANFEGDTLVSPIISHFDSRGFVNGLLATYVDERLTYFDKTGRVVWQEEEQLFDDPQPLNIDFMNRGYFYAGYNHTGHGNDPSAAENEYVTMLNSFPGAALSVVVDQDLRAQRNKSLKGIAVFVANTTGDTIRFNAQDGRLYMKTQALDPKGVWRDIEYLPSSWCGNSYHHVDLPANQYWTFVAPVYEGSFHTRLRIELTYIDPRQKIEPGVLRREASINRDYQLVVYSKEFDGSINPAQFWRKPDYAPSSIMDPYNE